MRIEMFFAASAGRWSWTEDSSNAPTSVGTLLTAAGREKLSNDKMVPLTRSSSDSIRSYRSR